MDGQSTLQLHQQRQAARASAHLTSLLVLPPDSEIGAPVLIHSQSGIQPGRCSLIEPQIALTASVAVGEEEANTRHNTLEFDITRLIPHSTLVTSGDYLNPPWFLLQLHLLCRHRHHRTRPFYEAQRIQ